MSDANVIAVLNTIDRNEIDAAQLAKRKATSSEVRALAARIVNEHSAMIGKNWQLVEQLDRQPENPQLALALKQTHVEAMEKLRKTSGSAFDRTYIQYQITMHEEAITLVQDTAESAGNSPLKHHLAQTWPDLASHLSAARAVERHLVSQR